jgi:hypothetical protein
MKLATIIGTAIAAVGLAACGSTSVSPPTARPTVAPTVAPATAPTATPTTAPAPKPRLGVYVTATCSNVLDLGQFAATGYPSGSILGKATWHGVKVGDYLGLPEPLTTLITSNPFSIGVVGFGSSTDAFTQGTWDWAEWTGFDQTTEVAHGTVTVPACPGKTIR